MKNGIRLFGLAFLIMAASFTAKAQGFLTNGLIAHLPFDGNGNDVSGNGYTATFTNCQFGTNRSGLSNAACDFNGTSSYAKVPALTFGAQFTISVWFQFNATAGKQFQRIFDFGNGTGIDNIILCQATGTPIIGFELDDSSGNNNRITNTVALQTGHFYQAVCVLSNSQHMLFYVNGQLVSQKAATIAYHQGSRANNLIGKSNWAADPLLNGAVDDMRIYNRALSSSEVLQLYNYELSPMLTIKTAVEVGWNTLTNQTYQLQRSTNFTNWSNVGNPVVGFGGATNQFFSITGTNQFYRLNVQ
jgi:hypothetical protein